ncbi:MAG TPA: hypothetical protein DCP31_26990 [Cyanobacteria bacterium UBA8543]|nr:hypothetical protein [Cyanobacteria bacterium UBA8543]
MTFALASSIGTVTTLSCERVKPTQVNCEKSMSVFFGLIPQRSSSFYMVTEAIFKSETSKGRKSNTENYSVALVTRQGQFDAFNDAVNDASQMKALTTQINTFIQSNERLLVLKQDSRGSWLNIVFLLLIIPMYLLIIAVEGLFFVLLSFSAIYIVLDLLRLI